MVQVHLDPPKILNKIFFGAIAQLGERLPCTQEVSGSIPLSSTTFLQLTDFQVMNQIDLNNLFDSLLAIASYDVDLVLLQLG